jgi:hypothetical protein
MMDSKFLLGVLNHHVVPVAKNSEKLHIYNKLPVDPLIIHLPV